jgi:hypothetical protein
MLKVEIHIQSYNFLLFLCCVCFDSHPDGREKKMHRIDFSSVDQFHGSVHHGNHCVANRMAHRNFVDESAWLMANNIWNEGT